MATPTEKVTTMQELRRATAPEAQLPVIHMGFDSLQGFELLQRAAKALAASTLVPKEYIGNMPNCMIALEMAQRIGASPLMVCQNLYVVHGRPGWSAKFLIASFNQCGRFSAARFDWCSERGKDEWGCRAWATEKGTGERIEGPMITIALAKLEGWYEKSGSKWKTIPELMLMYRAAAWMINTHAPEISMGLNTVEELHDTFDARVTSDGSYAVQDVSDLRQEDDPKAPAKNGEIVDAEAVETKDTKPDTKPENPAESPTESTASADTAADTKAPAPTETIPPEPTETEHLLQCVREAETVEDLDYVRSQNTQREATDAARLAVTKALDVKAKKLRAGE